MAKRKTWRCFHCDEVFLGERQAAYHFGATEGATPACKLASSEVHLLVYIRKLEARLQREVGEDTEFDRAWYSLEAECREKVIRAEERGYDKGVQEAKRMFEEQHGPNSFNPFAPTPETPPCN